MGPARRVRLLEPVGVVGVRQGQRDVVETVQQALPRLGVDLEPYNAVTERDGLALEVDSRLAGLHQRAHANPLRGRSTRRDEILVRPTPCPARRTRRSRRATGRLPGHRPERHRRFAVKRTG